MYYNKGDFTVVPCIKKLEGKGAIIQSIYLWLCFYSNTDGVCYPSINTLSENIGITTNSCKKYLKMLCDFGLLYRERRFSKNEETTSLYKIIISKELLDIKNPINKNNEEIQKEFNMFWEEYPRKQGKCKAMKIFKKQTEDIEIDLLLLAVIEYKNNTNPEYYKHGDTFLLQKVWLDYDLEKGRAYLLSKKQNDNI